MLADRVATAFCLVCNADRPRTLVEQFGTGAFMQCTGCGVQFAEGQQADLEAFYRDIWSEGNLGCDPYAEKIEAAHDPEKLEEMLTTIPRFRWAVAELQKLDRGARILDVGCGEGAILWAARQMGFEPHGCDLAEPAVHLARELIGSNHIQVGTINDINQPPQSFDAVVALEVLEHLPNPRTFLHRAANLLKPDGVLLLTMPNRHRVFAVIKRALGQPHSSTDYPPHHLTRWSAAALHGLLSQVFGSVSVGSLPYHFAHSAGRALAGPLHLLTGERMGQSLCACTRRAKFRSRPALSDA